ncbi:DUF6470 family protein [Gracilibacillus salinarum]|uniref:DUF6470 family protein n=1 Tax=Gracilibacillus salinarum TaxID=2932255 RepID=A0ABY4GLS6_9BACI|nr:DUF6470 family protein [Gracilibacillus salinarum]UOQ85171.1 DUF6470 family protein [Gracilibacillus salinarum]
MDLPQIRLQSQFAQISIKENSAQLSIKQPQADLSIQQPKADMQISTTPSKLSIDQSQAWNELGFKSVSEMTKEQAQAGKQTLLEVIARRRRQGDQLMKIENGGNPLISQAVDNAIDDPKQINIKWIPSHGSVKIDYQPAKLDIRVTPQEPLINVTPNKPVTNYKAGNVQIGLQQKNQLEIDFVNLKYVGINFEMEI